MKQPIYADGTMIAGRYRIDRAVARGGCSVVYQGTHVEMQRPVALKLMSPLSGDEDRAWVERFKREARLASKLRHPNTITIFDYGSAQGILFIAMEWVEGLSLRQAIRQDGAIQARRVATLTLQLLGSLEEAHQQHILHRDVKPSNIMLTTSVEGDELLKVLDFGLAKIDAPDYAQAGQAALTRPGDFVGTPRYASPEQLRGHALTPASDLYGVGMVMWEMLVGEPAVPDIDFGTCVQHHLGPSPWRLPSGISCPAGLASVVEQALEKDPLARYQDCASLREALEGWLEVEARGRPRDLFGTIEGIGSPAAASEALSAQEEEEAAAPLLALRDPDDPRRGRAAPPAPQALGVEVSSDPHSAPALELTPRPRLKRTSGTVMAMAPPERVSLSARRERGVAGAASLVVGAAVVVALGLGGWRMARRPAGEVAAPIEDAAVPEGSGEQEALAPSEPARGPSAHALEHALQRAGWKLAGQREVLELSSARQTSWRARDGRDVVELVVYECTSEAQAQELMQSTEPGVRASRFEQTVVRARPAPGSDAEVASRALGTMRALLP